MWRTSEQASGNMDLLTSTIVSSTVVTILFDLAFGISYVSAISSTMSFLESVERTLNLGDAMPPARNCFRSCDDMRFKTMIEFVEKKAIAGWKSCAQLQLWIGVE